VRRLRAIAIGLALLVGGAWPVAGVPGVAGAPRVACAAAVGPRAVLVVDNGARVVRLCVALDAESVSGTRLIELASAQHGLTYSLGFGGQAVCMLAGVGPTGGDCFADHPNFWGYWHGDGRGGWSWASGSAASYRVREGAVEGWVWGSGDTPSSHAKPPSTRFADVCPAAPSPSVPAPSPGGSGSSDGSTGDAAGSTGGSTGSGGAGATGGSGRGGSAATAKTDAPQGPDDRDEGEEGTGPKPTPEPTTRSPRPSATTAPEAPDAGQDTLRAAGTTTPDGSGPPIGVLLAILAGLGLATAGWWRVRGRAGGGRPNGDPR
jgi:hypothetical protein